MNWGNRLLLVFIVFGLGMSYLAYRAMNTDFELVESDYYKQELGYQQVIDGTAKANKLSSAIQLVQSGDGIVLQLPAEMNNKKIEGDIWFYCAYDSKKDRKLSIETDTNGKQLLKESVVEPGNYTVKINWKDDQNKYYTEKFLTVL